MSCPFKRKQQIIQRPSGDPSTWIPIDKDENVCKLQFIGDMVFGFEKCMGEDKCPIIKER